MLPTDPDPKERKINKCSFEKVSQDTITNKSIRCFCCYCCYYKKVAESSQKKVKDTGSITNNRMSITVGIKN